MNKTGNKTGQIFIVSAPSGAGKTSVVMRVIEKLKNLMPIQKVITYTTRPKRSVETDGIDYHFLTPQDFLNKKAQDFFLETTQYNGYYYGSPKSITHDVKHGKSFIIVTDMPGAKNLKTNLLPSAVTIWITIPNIQELRKRLEKRGTDSPEVIEKRLEMARKEMAQEAKENFFDFHVQNNKFDTAVDDVIKIIKQKLEV